MSVSEMRELSPTPFTPQLMLGAASPLWGFFASAAATGVAFWWMSQWSRPARFDALFGQSRSTVSPELAPALPASSDPQAVAEPATAVALKALEPFIAAVESAEAPVEELAAEVDAYVGQPPLSALETALAPAPEIAPEPVTFGAEPVVEPEPAPFTEAETATAAEAPRPRRKALAQPAQPPAAEPTAE